MLCAKVKYEVNKNKTESKMENPTHSFREINHAGHTLEIFGLKGQVFIKKTTFFEIRDPKISPPLPIFFNKAARPSCNPFFKCFASK